MELNRVRSTNTFAGVQAPDFSLPNQKGEWMSLSDIITAGPVMLIFYPGDFRLVCTKQLCAYQDAIKSFGNFGVQLAGISTNPPTEHQQFTEKYQFSFPLLTDVNRNVTRSYGVSSLFMMGGTSRAVFIVSKTGKILYRHVEPTTLTYRKPNELLEAIQKLRRNGEI